LGGTTGAKAEGFDRGGKSGLQATRPYGPISRGGSAQISTWPTTRTGSGSFWLWQASGLERCRSV